MGVTFKLRQFQLVLLELYAGFRELDQAAASYKPLYRSLSWNPSCAERQRKNDQKSLDILYRRISYLRRLGYIQRTKEAEKCLYRLTSKGKYELLRLRFANHIKEHRNKSQSDKYWVIIFDIPEYKRKYRDFFRHLLKENGFKMWQYSVWVTQCNPNPHFDNLLEYLNLKNYFALLEVDRCKIGENFIKRFES